MKDQIIEGVLRHQVEGTGPLVPYTPEELTRIIQDLERDKEIINSLLEYERAENKRLTKFINQL
jgi:signal transduction histidine kinase